MFLDGKKFASDALSNFADIVATISISYNKTDEAQFRSHMLFFLGTRTY